jgi:predicted secreted Zn-dependent protease
MGNRQFALHKCCAGVAEHFLVFGQYKRHFCPHISGCQAIVGVSGVHDNLCRKVTRASIAQVFTHIMSLGNFHI